MVSTSAAPHNLGEISKADAATNQMRLVDRVIGVRLLLQKAVTTTKRLPRESCVVISRQSCCKAVRHALSAVVELLASSAAAGPWGMRGGITGASLDQLGDSAAAWWERADCGYKALAAARDNAIERFQMSIDGGYINTKEPLLALGCSVTAQVMQAMSQPERLFAKYAPLPPSGAPHWEFEDKLFYRHLCKLSRQSGCLPGREMRRGLSTAGALKLREKRREGDFDRCSSKGKRLRQKFIPDLSNFMAEAPKTIPPLAEALLAHLFVEGARQAS